MINPYEGVNWQSAIRVPSATHMHIVNQENLDNGYRYGVRHFPISNYYPSAPYDANTRLSDFRLRQWWGTVRDGRRLDPPINWNDIITWEDELEEPYRSDFPFAETEPVYTDIPEDVILSHNAEHHGWTNSSAHICSPGSSFASGTFDCGKRSDLHWHYHLDKHGFPWGFGGTWQEGFKGMLQGLDYPDGGGITINHPTSLTRFSDDQVFEMLDFDERVLGIEIYNDTQVHQAKLAAIAGGEAAVVTASGMEEIGFSLNTWDRILSTGRRCWGFCVPDHKVEKGGNWIGRSVLLVSEFTEHNCLKAYRQGQFYGCLKDSGLTIRDFTVTDSSISVSTNSTARIKFITGAGVASTVTGNSATYELGRDNSTPEVTYVRVEVEDDSGERLFLQPVMWTTGDGRSGSE